MYDLSLQTYIQHTFILYTYVYYLPINFEFKKNIIEYKHIPYVYIKHIHKAKPNGSYLNTLHLHTL